MNPLLLIEFYKLLPLLPAIVVVLFFVMPPFYKEGRNQYLFLQKNIDNQVFLIIISNFLSVYMGKGGSSEKHRMRIKKIDLQTGALVYSEKIANFRSGFLDGYLNVLAQSGNYIYLDVNGKNLLILDMRSGKKVADKRELLSANAEVVDFSMKDMKINPENGLLQCYNIEGKLLEIDPEAMKIAVPNERKVEKTGDCQEVYKNWPFFRENNTFRIYLKDGDDTYDADWEQEAGSKRVCLKISPSIGMAAFLKKTNTEAFEHSTKSVSFIHPTLLARYSDIIFLKNPYRFLVQHQAFLEKKNGVENYYLSLITGNSEELWRQRYANLIHQSLLKSTEHKLYISFEEEVIWLFFASDNTTRLSVSSIETASGMVLQAPLLVKNSWWERKSI